MSFLFRMLSIFILPATDEKVYEMCKIVYSTLGFNGLK